MRKYTDPEAQRHLEHFTRLFDGTSGQAFVPAVSRLLRLYAERARIDASRLSHCWAADGKRFYLSIGRDDSNALDTVLESVGADTPAECLVLAAWALAKDTAPQ